MYYHEEHGLKWTNSKTTNHTETTQETRIAIEKTENESEWLSKEGKVVYKHPTHNDNA